LAELRLTNLEPKKAVSTKKQIGKGNLLSPFTYLREKWKKGEGGKAEKVKRGARENLA